MTAVGDDLEATGSASNVTAAMKLAMRFFLETKHYRKLNRVLAEQWKGIHSLIAAVRLMEAHGVNITGEKQGTNPNRGFGGDSDDLPDWLKKLDDENRAIDALVQMMPSKTPEQFEHFFLQLSFIASTTQRLRTALETGQPELIDEALESAENVGVLPYLLKMAVSQAGQEVKNLEDEHDRWLASTDSTLAPLLTTASVALAVQKELTQAKSTIAHFQGEAKEKSRAVLTGLADGNEKALLASVFGAFSDYTKRLRRESEIKREYQDEIDAVNKKLFDYREAQLEKVKKALQKQTKAHLEEQLRHVMQALKAEEAAIKHQREVDAQSAELTAHMEKFSQDAAENARKVFARMCADNDSAAVAMGFKAFKHFAEEAKKERALEAELQEQKDRMDAFQKRQKEGAKSVLNNITQQSATALVSSVFVGWRELCRDDKAQQEMMAHKNAKSSMMAEFADRNKSAGEATVERIHQLEEVQMVIFVFTTWKREAKIDRMRRACKAKTDKHKKELVGVKGLFKNFANEVRSSLDKGTPRPEMLQHRRAPAALPSTGPKAD